MEQFQIKNPVDFQNLIEIKKDELKDLIQQSTKELEESVENEFDLFEFNIFLACIGKDKLDKTTERVIELRRKVESGKISLSKYEDMFDED
jgi:hypothetical protein